MAATPASAKPEPSSARPTTMIICSWRGVSKSRHQCGVLQTVPANPCERMWGEKYSPQIAINSSKLMKYRTSSSDPSTSTNSYTRRRSAALSMSKVKSGPDQRIRLGSRMIPGALSLVEVAKSSGIATGRDAGPISEEREETIVIAYEPTVGTSHLEGRR